MYAANNGHIYTAKCLLENKANIEAKDLVNITCYKFKDTSITNIKY